MATGWGNIGNSDRLLIFLGSKITADDYCSHGSKICFLLGRKAMTNLASIFKSRDINLPKQVCLWFFQSYGFSSSHVWMWDLNHKEGWALKNWCFWTVVLKRTLESPLDCKKIKPLNPKGNQPWISLEGLMLKLRLQYFSHLVQRANSLEKTLMLGR